MRSHFIFVIFLFISACSTQSEKGRKITNEHKAVSNCEQYAKYLTKSAVLKWATKKSPTEEAKTKTKGWQIMGHMASKDLVPLGYSTEQIKKIMQSIYLRIVIQGR